MAHVLVLNADAHLKRLVNLALPGMEHFVRHADVTHDGHPPPSPTTPDLVIVRLMVDETDTERRLRALRSRFPDSRLILATAHREAVGHDDRFQQVVRELHVAYCLREPITTGTMLQSIQAALSLPRRS